MSVVFLDHYKKAERKAKLLGSYLLFTQVFYKLRTGRDFVISQPIGRESHHLIIARNFTKVFNLELDNLLMNLPPGSGKSELSIHLIAWAFARYPDCQFIYLSSSKDLAAGHTYTVKKIMELPEYRDIFGVEISHDSSAKDNFKTTQGGKVRAFGSSGPVVGQDAGFPNCDRFSGGLIMDDMHKPDEVHSDLMRESVIENYKQTVKPRRRGPKVPFIFLGHRLHQGDLAAYLLKGSDGNKWHHIVLKALDDAGNALYPNVNSLEMLKEEQKNNSYVFAAQYQQEPKPPGGSLFGRKDFPILDEEPKFISTFLTVDTAETDKDYNDATVFSFWGLYKIKQFEVETSLYGIHWIKCKELRILPRYLKSEFLNFYADCMRSEVKPSVIYIEKKSTGVTLLSVLEEVQGMNVIGIERTKASGNKTSRYLEMEPYIHQKLVSFPQYGQHNEMCINHMEGITANDTHLFDDICDTAYDAVRAALIDKIVPRGTSNEINNNPNLRAMTQHAAQLVRAKQIRNQPWIR